MQIQSWLAPTQPWHPLHASLDAVMTPAFSASKVCPGLMTLPSHLQPPQLTYLCFHTVWKRPPIHEGGFVCRRKEQTRMPECRDQKAALEIAHQVHKLLYMLFCCCWWWWFDFFFSFLFVLLCFGTGSLTSLKLTK